MEIQDWVKDELGQDIWKKKYQQNNETFDEWLDRVSGKDKSVRALIEERKFLFGGRILASRGITDRKVTYSNCYVLPPVGDSIEDIYDTAKYLARTFSYGGGCGIDISQLRPKGSPVNNAAKTTSGAVSFMETFSSVSEVIGQEGRRGALMISMDCNHPDVGDFIDAKKNTDKLTGCNISVRVDDNFMNRINLVGKESELFFKLAENNWHNAEPGILYWDTIAEYNMLNTYEDFKFAGVNPCAEEPLPAGGSCLLGAINLSEFVENPFTDKAAFNIPDFKATVRIAVKALNDVLDEGLDLHPLDIQKKCVSEWRQIGLGIMGFADALIKLGIRYGEQRSLELIDIIGKAMVQAGVHESIQIAKDTQSFEKFNCVNTINSSFIRAHMDVIYTDDIMKYGIRNSQLFTIAPTGSISTMLGVSGGVEPIFQPTYTRTTKSLDENGDKTYTVVTPIIQQFLEANNLTQDDINNANCITWAEKLNPLERVDVQAKWQEYIDASISSTVNLSNETTVSQVALLYKYAWERGCKGLTIYRAGCDREGILKSIEEKPKQSLVKNEEINKDELQRGEWAPIPEDTIYYKRKVYTGCGKINLFIGYSLSENKITDFYVKRSAEGGCEHNIDGQVICMSGMLRLGGSLANIEKAFKGLGACNSFTRAKCSGKKVSKGKSCPTAILNEIKAFEQEMIYKKQPKVLEPLSIVIDEAQILSDTSKCPECGAELQMTGGCNVCSSCGYTKCD